ncbi:class I SAM-dependent methyltransferase [Bacteroidota bacterium]
MFNSWDKRYSTEEYVYGTEPNEFFKEEIEKIKPGKVLFLGEGEGRNAVFAASKGWQVDAVDASSGGKEKALKFAAINNVEINYTVADFNNYLFSPDTYDAVVAIYLHLPEELRVRVHTSAVKALKPGGNLILEAFEKEQIKNNSGGPRNEDLLYSLEDIYSDFHELEISKFSKELIHLSEGKLHDGAASVIRYTGTKLK